MGYYGQYETHVRHKPFAVMVTMMPLCVGTLYKSSVVMQRVDGCNNTK
jgi:hypothetical protein